MKIVSFALAFAAAINVAFAAPLTAHAAPTNVQPIPYAPSQPVPVGQPPSQPLPPLPPTTAPVAATGGNDVIVLKGGGMLRGRLIEVIPNDHATISLPTGQNAIVEWSRIDRIEQQQQAAPSVLVQGKTAAAPGPSGMVWIHIDSDHELVLEGRPADGGWSIVCTAPCDTGVPLEYEYRISGSGIRTSHSFRIEGAAGQHVILSVKAGSKAGFVGGIVLASISPVVIVVGLLVALVGAIEQTDYTTLDCAGCSTNSSGKSTETTGWIITLVGVGGLVIGIVLVATNARTSQTQEVLRPGAPPPRRDDAWLRVPTWHEMSGAERALPPIQSAPIFSRSF